MGELAFLCPNVSFDLTNGTLCYVCSDGVYSNKCVLIYRPYCSLLGAESDVQGFWLFTLIFSNDLNRMLYPLSIGYQQHITFSKRIMALV